MGVERQNGEWVHRERVIDMEEQKPEVEQVPETKKEEKPPESLPTKRNPMPILSRDDGTLVGNTFEEQYRLARAYYASGLMPAALDSPEKVLVAVQLCRELNLPPMTSVGKICVINGTPSIFGDLPLALVQRSGKLEYIKEELFDEKGPLDLNKPLPAFFGASCTLKRIGQPELNRVFTQVDAVKAGIWGKKVWAVYPKRMMQMRARGWAIKDAFPDVIMGVSIAEYDHDTVPGMDSRNMPVKQLTIAQEINDSYSDEKSEDKEPGAVG